MIKAKPARAALTLFFVLSPAAVFAGAQDGEAEAVHRLSPEEVVEISASSEDPQIDAEALLGDDIDGHIRRHIQSQVTFGIGTGGYRELSGSTLIPLGRDGFLALGLGHVEDNRLRRYHYGRGYDF